ncbi:MAG: endonuclease III [Clostridia bacterium]|nr:endonuclease III [Clostridia bacterium]
MKVKEIAKKAEIALEKLYPDALCSLQYSTDYELLFAVRLSAQCTDARVNIVCADLFVKFPTLESFADADITELEKAVKPCGFYRTKAQNIKDSAKMLIEKFNSKVPDNMEDVLSLPGVGRKTANLILGDIYKQPSAVVADTHCIRISNRLGLALSKEPEKVEKALREVLTPETSSDFCHRLVLFGREYCTARKPKCDICPLAQICKENNK